MADQTIVNYEMIEKYGKDFEEQAEMISEAINALKQKAQGLESFWIGQAAEKFFDEFYQEVLPATTRLHAVLILGAEVLRKIINLFESSDEECAGYFSESALDSGMAASVSDLQSGSGGGGGGGGSADQSKGMQGNLKMGVAASGQGASPGAGGSSSSSGMADNIYDTGAGGGGQATPASTAAASGGGATEQADSSNLPKAAGGIAGAGAAAAGAAAKKKKDDNNAQD